MAKDSSPRCSSLVTSHVASPSRARPHKLLRFGGFVMSRPLEPLMPLSGLRWGAEMRGQAGFFDVDERLRQISVEGL